MQNNRVQDPSELTFDARPVQVKNLALRTAPSLADGGLIKELLKAWR
jgi:hypothetical protein